MNRILSRQWCGAGPHQAKLKKATKAVNSQSHLLLFEPCSRKWGITIKEDKNYKRVYVTFALLIGICIPITLNQILIPQASIVPYLGLILDK